MRYRTFLLSLLLVLSFAAQAANILNQGEKEDGWILLFDGETTFGWQKHGNADFRVEEGVLVAGEGADGWLSTTYRLADYILKLEYRTAPGGSSAVLLRTSAEDLPGKSGLSIQITEPSGSLTTPATGEEAESETLSGKWNEMTIFLIGRGISVMINGLRSTETIIPAQKPRQATLGHIGIRGASGTSRVEFRNIKLKPLSLASIFNSEDLTGWNVLEGHASKYSVTSEGWLNVRDGGGDIQTQSLFQDFILQLDVISNGTHLNSGVFFRGEPGQFWSGYESQIRNQWEGVDRAKPVDFGTGGLYGLQPARKVVPSDGEWFRKTIVCEGNHIAIWVNGFQTVDFTDTRERGRNARHQQRLEAGVISLQGHDPTTDLSFRRIEVAPLPKRPE